MADTLIVRPQRWRTERGQRHRNNKAIHLVLVFVGWIMVAFPLGIAFSVAFKNPLPIPILFLLTPILSFWSYNKRKKKIEQQWGHMPLTSPLHPDDQPLEWSRPRRAQRSQSPKKRASKKRHESRKRSNGGRHNKPRHNKKHSGQKSKGRRRKR